MVAKQSKESKSSLVAPGTPLTVEEEFAAGKNTYVDDDGNVVATATGEVQFDEHAREVHVHPKGREPQGLEVGSIVFGRVMLIKSAVVVLSMAEAHMNGTRRKIFEGSATIGISRAAQQYVRALEDHFKIGDYVKARVVEVSPTGVELATNEEGLGVIFSREQIIQNLVAGNETFVEVEKRVPAFQSHGMHRGHGGPHRSGGFSRSGSGGRGFGGRPRFNQRGPRRF